MAFGQPRLAAELNLETVPSRVTLSRRYKQVAPKLEAFIAYLEASPLIQRPLRK